jgi:hypothetical protein
VVRLPVLNEGVADIEEGGTERHATIVSALTCWISSSLHSSRSGDSAHRAVWSLLSTEPAAMCSSRCASAMDRRRSTCAAATRPARSADRRSRLRHAGPCFGRDPAGRRSWRRRQLRHRRRGQGLPHTNTLARTRERACALVRTSDACMSEAITR